MFFLLDGKGQHIGPFKNREGVARFIRMMALSGEDWAGNQIVEQGGDDEPKPNPAQVDSCANQLKGASKLKLVRRKS